jgi:two-component system sensor histidine kinase AlgZ
MWRRTGAFGPLVTPVILVAMRLSDLPARAQPTSHLPSSAQIARVLVFNLFAWGVLSAMGTASVSNQLSDHGQVPAYFEIFCESWKSSLIQTLTGTLLYTMFWRWPAPLKRARSLVMLYGATLSLFFFLDAAYRAGLQNSQTAAAALQAVPRFEWFIDFVLVSGTFTFQAALCIWRQGQARERAMDLVEKENLHLHLELEQSRMSGLRAQLEPHFLFNALNAISALVRAHDNPTALTGIGRLSGLLRYALTASAREWVTIGEELAFVQDYLALQQLRYGPRLNVAIDVDNDDILAATCPPLLLQPLVENALRHDLDCHDRPGDICLRFRSTERELFIVISNPIAAPGTAQAAANPGLGLGLHHTEASLKLAFGKLASLHTRQTDGRFVVELRLPLL